MVDAAVAAAMVTREPGRIYGSVAKKQGEAGRPGKA